MELNFEVPEMQKWNIPLGRSQIGDEKNGITSSYHVYFRSYGH